MACEVLSVPGDDRFVTKICFGEMDYVNKFALKPLFTCFQ
jgi:hypothetical protein